MRVTESRGIAFGVPEETLYERGYAPMDLCFVCPLSGKGYTSGSWRIIGELRMEEDMHGNRRLKGKVEVDCPHCEGMHACSTEELVCPWSQAGG